LPFATNLSFVEMCVRSRITGIIVWAALLLLSSMHSAGQCGTPISTFPYTEGFEATNGSWAAGGTASDWIWGTPSKSFISGAGGGTKCWITGGLTGNFYNVNEDSWVRSPCFNFSGLSYPYIEFKVYWETERQFDYTFLEYSLNGGSTWSKLGSTADPVNCLNTNWYNYTTSVWCGTVLPNNGSCRGGGGSGGWVVARHTMPYLAGATSVRFRFAFRAGSTCNNFNGFAFDDVYIGEAPPNDADFSYTCTTGNTVSFTNTSDLCPTVFSWNFDDPANGASNTSTDENPDHTFSGPGEYDITLTVSGPDNAPSTIIKKITILGATTSIVSPVSCFNGNDGSVNAAGTGAPGPYSYSWNTNPVQSTATATGLPAGSYTVTVSAANVCPGQATIVLPGPASFTHTITKTDPDCNRSNGSATVSVSGGTPPYTYNWLPTGGTGATASNLAAGNYTITITDSKGCPYSVTLQLNNALAPVITLTGSTDVSCFNKRDGSIATTVSGGSPAYTYSWSPAGGNAATATNLAAADYTLTVTDQGGCTAILTHTISEPDELVVTTVSEDASCGLANGSVELTASGGTPVYTYSWSPAVSTTAIAQQLAPGNYTITVSDSKGCMVNYPPINITNNGIAPVVNLGKDTTICFGETLLLSAGLHSFYEWQDLSPRSTFLVTDPGKYWVRVTNTDGCEASDTILVEVNPACNDIFFPTAFTPNADSRNDLFGPIGNLSGITGYRFAVYNRWGELVFFSKNPFVKWDGRFKSSKPDSNVFAWFAEFTLPGKKPEQRKGTVLLLR